MGMSGPFAQGMGWGKIPCAAFAPRPSRQMFVRGCEWAATGKVERTAHFDGSAVLTANS